MGMGGTELYKDLRTESGSKTLSSSDMLDTFKCPGCYHRASLPSPSTEGFSREYRTLHCLLYSATSLSAISLLQWHAFSCLLSLYLNSHNLTSDPNSWILFISLTHWIKYTLLSLLLIPPYLVHRLPMWFPINSSYHMQHKHFWMTLGQHSLDFY